MIQGLKSPWVVRYSNNWAEVQDCLNWTLADETGSSQEDWG